MFKLAERRATATGVYCGKSGFFLGRSPVIEEAPGGGYRLRPAAEIVPLLAAAYQAPPDIEHCLAGLHRVVDALRSSNLPLAMIAAVQIGLPDIEDERIERLGRAEALLKANYNPNEPRDAHGRWTDAESGEGGKPGAHGIPGGENSGSSGGQNMPTSAGGSGAAMSPVWKNYPNADFRNRLAEAEGSQKPGDFGYGAVLDRTDRAGRHLLAFGRYQMTPAALQAAGIMDRNGAWTGKYGIHSRAEFLADPDGQERALTDYLAQLDRELGAKWGLFSYRRIH